MTLNNLGNVQRDLNELEAARDSFTEATQLYDEHAATLPTPHLVERQGCWANLGQLFLQESPRLGWPDLHRARQAFHRARDCAEVFRGRFVSPDQRRRVQGESLHVYEQLVETCVDIGQVDGDVDAFQEAVEVAEASRARNLMDLLADEALNPTALPRTWWRSSARCAVVCGSRSGACRTRRADPKPVRILRCR